MADFQVKHLGSTGNLAGAVDAEGNDMEMNLKMVNLCTSWIYPVALRTIVELDVPRILATNHTATNPSHEGNTGMTAGEILQHIVREKKEQKHEDVETLRPNALNLERLLRLLTTKAIFAEHIGHNARNDVVERRFSLTPMSRCLVPGKGSLHHSVLLMALTPESAATLEYLGDTVLKSEDPFTNAHGMKWFEYMTSHPAYLEALKSGFTDTSLKLLPTLLSRYHGFEGVRKLIDVGGNSGQILAAIKHKHPHIHAINFDLPDVIASNPTLPGIEQVGGDMFKELPSGCDAIFMKTILHDWSDEECLAILNNCWTALPSVGGKVIIVDFVMPMETPQEDTVAIGKEVVFASDFMMQLHCPSGRERSAMEIEGLLKQAKFTNFQVVSEVGYCYIMEAFK